LLVTVHINGIEYEVKEGEFILQVCRKLEVFVPHLCYLEGMPPSGKCGLCAVEIDEERVALSCITPAKAGMKIKTSSEKLTYIRQNNISRLLKNHKIDCFNCSKCGVCKLQIYGARLNSKTNNIENFDGKSCPEESQIKLKDNLFYDKSKCVYCTRCVKFLSEICGIDLIAIDAFEKTEKVLDLVGNIIDICPTEALTQRSSDLEFKLEMADKIQTFDVSCVFTPKISVSKQDNKIVNISNVESNWIKDDTKFIYHKLNCCKKITSYANEIIEKIAFEIDSKSPEKKVFILGDNIDLLTFSYIKYMAYNLKNVFIALDDNRIPRNIMNDIGLFDQDLSLMDFSIIVGDRYLSDKYYINNLANNLKGSVSLKLQELNKFVSTNKDEKLLFSCNFPYMFIYSDFFKDHNVEKVLNIINRIKKEYEETFKQKLNVKIIPTTITQIYARYLKKYMSIDELLLKFNRHDVKFAFIVGDLGYKSDYNDILTIQHVSFDDPKQKKDEYLQSTHFLEDSGFYINVFGEIVQTKKVLDSDLKSNREFIFELMSAIYGEDFQDINEEIKREIRDVFLSKYNI